MGFAVPIGEWFRGELRPMLRDHLFAADSFARAHFNLTVVERLVDEHETQRVDHSQRSTPCSCSSCGASPPSTTGDAGRRRRLASAVPASNIAAAVDGSGTSEPRSPVVLKATVSRKIGSGVGAEAVGPWMKIESIVIGELSISPFWPVPAKAVNSPATRCSGSTGRDATGCRR